MRSHVARGYVGASLCVCVCVVWVLSARLRPFPEYGVVWRRIFIDAV